MISPRIISYPLSYRHTFNGMEKDDEIKGKGNSLDFGARVYDSRLGRFLSMDPKYRQLPYLSPYSYASNSPIFLIDDNGEDPKVAIILVPEKGEHVTDEGDHYYHFDTHIQALKDAGYTVVKVHTGEQALAKMKELSSPESPIEDLILLSHASPGGVSIAGPAIGIETESELEIFAKNDFYMKRSIELKKSLGLLGENIDNPGEAELLAPEKAKRVNEILEAEWTNKKDQIIKEWKSRGQGISTTDIANEIRRGGISVLNLQVVVAGCNTAGYAEYDGQQLFVKELSEKTGANVTGARGYTKPTSSGTSKRTADVTWETYSPDGSKKDLGKSTLNLTKPE